MTGLKINGKSGERRRLRLTCGVLAALGLLLAACNSLGSSAGPAVDTAFGGNAQESNAQAEVPDFPFIFYQGQNLVGSPEPRFASLLGNKPIVLNYWASNCPPCRAEMPGFEKVWRENQDRVLFVGLDVGRFFGFGGQDQSRKELKELGITYVGATPDTVETALKLEVLGLPTTVFVMPDGKIYRKWVGMLNEAKLTEIIGELLEAS